MIKKGIILAGGLGSRMSPVTKSVNKQLLPIYDKPLIYYPLSVLMLAGIRDILIIVNKGAINQFKKILKNGENFGVKIKYLEQTKPSGLPDAFKIGKNFIAKDNVSLILGDNFFYGQSLSEKLKNISKLKRGATILVHPVSNPKQFGVATIKNKKIIKLEEKPNITKSNLAVTGLYFFDNSVVKKVTKLKKSKRKEYEIIDLLKLYKKNGEERYPEFKLYKMIARSVHNHIPEKVFETHNYFQKYFVKSKIAKKQKQLMNIDDLPVYI